MGALTFPYKFVDDKPSYVDVYLPDVKHTARKALPVVLYFHGGGVTVGNRKSWFPNWIHKRAMQAGYAFISADYQLMSPATGHDIIADIKDLFWFLSTELNTLLSGSCNTDFQIDAESIVVSGSSAGGLCSYLAAIHAIPKPKGVLSLYGQGGDFLVRFPLARILFVSFVNSPQYLSIKTEPFFLGREILDPEEFRQFLYPFPPDLQRTTDSPLAYHPPTSPTPGYPANPRMQLCRLLLQMGVFLDYFTGSHEPSISLQLRQLLDLESDPDILASKTREIINPRHVEVFPQLLIDSSFPSAFLMHGGVDTAVRPGESRNMERLLKRVGVEVTLRIVDGEEHSFDYAPGSEDKHADLFDETFAFIAKVFST